MKRTKSTKWIIAVLLVIAGVTTYVLLKKNNGTTEYREMKVTRGSIQVTVLSTGYVQPENRLEIKPQVSGRVEKVLVEEGQYVKKGQVLAEVSSTERAALIDAARARGQEEQKKWEAYYKPMPVLAPINGTIILRSIEPGQTFTTADAVLVMSDRLTVKAQVDETDIAKVQLKQKAEIILDAYAERSIPAHVDQIAYEAKTINNVTTYIVDVLPENTPSFMLSGMTANVTFFVDVKDNILLLPSEAVKNNGKYFYVLAGEGKGGAKPIERKIETGSTDGKNVEIVSGLAENEVVLIANPKVTKEKAKNPFTPQRKRS